MIQWKFTELALVNIFFQETIAFKHSIYSSGKLPLPTEQPQNLCSTWVTFIIAVQYWREIVCPSAYGKSGNSLWRWKSWWVCACGCKLAALVLWPGRLCTKPDHSAGDQTCGKKGMTALWAGEVSKEKKAKVRGIIFKFPCLAISICEKNLKSIYPNHQPEP